MLRENEPAPDELSLDLLASRCREETDKWRKKLPNDPKFCLGIFRRAVAAQRDEEAWRLLVDVYTDFVKANVPWDPVLRDPEVRADIAQDAWSRFWNATRGGRLKCESLGEILSFLRKTTRSAVIEYKRKNRAPLEPLPRSYDPPDPENTFSDMDKQEFCARARVVLRDPVVFAVFWLNYRDDLPPREIVRVLKAIGLSGKRRPLTAAAVGELLRQSIRQLAEDPLIRELLRRD
jgi:hypothetical protein